MSSPRTFIIVKGQPKALQIDRIELGDNGLYSIKFKNSYKRYNYRYDDVVQLTNAVWHDSQHTKVYTNGREEHNVSDIYSFNQGALTHWRISYGSGFVKDYLHGTIQVVESCLEDPIAKNTFCYLTRVAQVNDLGKDDENEAILPALYEKIEFIDKSLAIVPYLDPERYKVSSLQSKGDLIFPFGCNASQEKAVTSAFEKQISVIQGPPGTGKTQTILNIIANILMQDKSVIVVSNNNSATANVLEKLQGYGLDFFVAPLGRRENKEEFIQNQPVIPQELNSWELSFNESRKQKNSTKSTLSQLRHVYALQEEMATLRQETKAVELEWEYFKRDNGITDDTFSPKKRAKSQRLMKLWQQYQARAEGEDFVSQGTLKHWLKWSWLNFTRKFLLGVQSPFDPDNAQPTILELQALYLIVRGRELNKRIARIEKELSSIDAEALTSDLTAQSLSLLKEALYSKYHKEQRIVYADVKALHRCADNVSEQYPVVLSTTFSARTSLPDHVYDYIIMDEASQVSIDTGALALSVAKNAVIVGDSMQLPNVVTEEDSLKYKGIFNEFRVAQGYNCADYCFLQSVCTILPDVEQTLLREHYRCHPTIINFCNQRFYGGNLLIMTEDHDEPDVMMAVKTVPGHHIRNHYNQREIDVVKNEVLPRLAQGEDVGIITPYNSQVNELNRQLPDIEASTIHKYQGREKDTIILSTVDDQISEFSDDANLINVAISRAKKRFCLVVSGNEQERKGNISDLIDYINYHNLSVTESKINSIFDYLYSHYTNERMAFLAEHGNISEYDSENLTYSLLENILAEYPDFSHLGILCHTPMRNVVKDWTLLSDEERKYISHYSTHLDFLIINHVTKKPVIAIETDGYSYHSDETEQHKRDLMKNHILEVYGLPLLRLRTNESNEKERIVSSLFNCMKGKAITNNRQEET